MMKTEQNFPHYISTNPTGEDLLDGQSQDRICKAITDHVITMDNIIDKKEAIMPRVIGIEGKWGSGKSNVLHRLREYYLNRDNDYYIFSYDAWANQEDLQRRSILQQLTARLISEKILNGKVKIRVQKPDEKNEFKTVEEDVPWQEKLDLLMAKRVKNITRAVSPLNTEFKLLMLVLVTTPILATIMNSLKFEDISGWCYFYITISIVLLPTIISLAIIHFSKHLQFKKMLRAYQSTTEDKTTHQIINEAEPTIHEFSSWMKEISDGIGKLKLIVVFDNMDRLPANKVKELWSSIHSIFSSNQDPKGHTNIWCFIPYDFIHLTHAFGENEELTRCFIQKSFPVIFRVPEPAINDYKNLFKTFFIKAFGEKYDTQDLNLISRCYRLIKVKPNVRDVITFINRMVGLEKQWGQEIHDISFAIYLLREEKILRHPTMTILKNDEYKEIECTTDAYLLSPDIIESFTFVNLDMETLRDELAAITYGIVPEDAYQVVMERALRDCLVNEKQELSINTYKQHRHFASMLQEIVNSFESDTTIYMQLIKVLDQLDSNDMTIEDKNIVAGIWKKFDKLYSNRKQAFEYGEMERILMRHAGDETRRKLAATFIKGLCNNDKVDGQKLYDNFTTLFNEDYAVNWDKNKICGTYQLDAVRYLTFVNCAKNDYLNYGLYAKNEILEKEMIDKLNQDFPYIDSLK